MKSEYVFSNARKSPYVPKDPTPIFDAIFQNTDDDSLPNLYLASLLSYSEDSCIIEIKARQAKKLREYLTNHDLPDKDKCLERLDIIEHVLKLGCNPFDPDCPEGLAADRIEITED